MSSMFMNVDVASVPWSTQMATQSLKQQILAMSIKMETIVNLMMTVCSDDCVWYNSIGRDFYFNENFHTVFRYSEHPTGANLKLVQMQKVAHSILKSISPTSNITIQGQNILVEYLTQYTYTFKLPMHFNLKVINQDTYSNCHHDISYNFGISIH